MSLTRRVTKRDLEEAEKRVNFYLDNVKVRVSRRYNYYAIDVYDKNEEHVIDTLASGLTAREAKEILDSIARLLYFDRVWKRRR